MSFIKIIKPGIQTTIQDNGRFGYQQFGMPVAGAMDIISLQLANYLVSNTRYEACLEASFLGPQIEFESNTFIGITGANMKPKLNGIAIPMYETIQINAGDKLNLASCTKGCRTYISISGGYDISVEMGSKSTYLRGAIGGFKGRQLDVNDRIKLNTSNKIKERQIPSNLISEYNNHFEARIIPGPEADHFTVNGLVNFINSKYTLTTQCDRMGFRLSGGKIEHKSKADIISSGINLGSIQVPQHGEPIIMMADRQTTGGYSRIANIISTDISFVAQLQAGDTISFMEVDLDFAHQEIKRREEQLLKLFQS